MMSESLKNTNEEALKLEAYNFAKNELLHRNPKGSR